MKVDGTHPLKADRELVFNLLNDPVVLARCIPGCQKLEPVGPNTYTTTLKVGIASMTGLYNARVNLEELTPPSHFRITIEGKGPQGFVRGMGSIDLMQGDGETLIYYSGDAQLGGTLASVGQRMLQGAAKMMTGQFFTAIEAEAVAKVQAEKAGEPLALPQHGVLRDFVQYLWGLVRRLFSGSAPGTPPG